MCNMCNTCNIAKCKNISLHRETGDTQGSTGTRTGKPNQKGRSQRSQGNKQCKATNAAQKTQRKRTQTYANKHRDKSRNKTHDQPRCATERATQHQPTSTNQHTAPATQHQPTRSSIYIDVRRETEEAYIYAHRRGHPDFQTGPAALCLFCDMGPLACSRACVKHGDTHRQIATAATHCYHLLQGTPAHHSAAT
jgi:hypothetical protein